MTDPNKAKLDEVGARLDALKNATAAKEKKETEKQESAQGAGVGLRVGIELMAGVLVGAGLGWLIDDKLGTKPIFMLALIAIGFAAAVLNVIRILKNLDQAVGLGRAIRQKEAQAQQPPPNAWNDEDD